MACHEIAALRLGLMRVLGRTDEAERRHDWPSWAGVAAEAGPIKTLCETQDLASRKRAYPAVVAALEDRVAATAPGDPKLPYLRTLVVLTKKVELDLEHQLAGLTKFYGDLDTMHDFVHEIYPAD